MKKYFCVGTSVFVGDRAGVIVDVVMPMIGGPYYTVELSDGTVLYELRRDELIKRRWR